MRTPSIPRKLVAGALALTVAALAWFFLAPTVLGGSTSYVVTDGISMQPHLHTGDIALVRARPAYHVGEIVAYRSRLLGTIVLHRIIGIAGDRYTFKGDNNDFVDPEHPRRDQVVGAFWVRLPKLAQRLAPLRRPAAIGALVTLGVLLLGGGAFGQQRRRRHRRADAGPAHLPQAAHDWVAGLLSVAAIVLSPLVALAVIAYHRPAVTLGPASVPYTQSGTFSYAAGTVWGPAYPHGRATTGDPLFLRLVHTVRLRFEYRFGAAAAHAVSGSASLAARITSSTGWKHTVQLQEPRRFAGDRAVLTGDLDLRPLPALLHELETTTAVAASYTLTLVPHVRVDGQTGGYPVHAVFSPPLAFSLTDRELQPTLSGTDSSTDARGSPLSPSAAGSATGEERTPASISLKVASVSVAHARTFASRGLAAALCALVGCALAFMLGERRRPAESSSIQARHRRRLIPVAHPLRPSELQVVEVTGMEALAGIAERYDRMILHESGAGIDTYSVADDGLLYRYVAQSETALVAARTPAPVAGVTAIPALRDISQPAKRSA